MDNSKIRYKLVCSVFTILIGLYTLDVSCQDFEDISVVHKTVAPLIHQYQLEKALAACKNFDENDLDVIAAKSIIYSLMGNRDKEDSDIEKGFSLLQPYLTIKDNYNIYVALAVSYGIQANHSGLRKKIELADISIQNSKEALKLKSNLPHPNFILGRFYFELSQMSRMTAQIAKSMLNKEEIERASYDLALSYLEKASTLLPTRFLYNYYTGAVYKKLGDNEKAQYYFRLADNNERHTADDFTADKDLQKQLR
jgi:tetratricopeptide (TPR) repeat protein